VTRKLKNKKVLAFAESASDVDMILYSLSKHSIDYNDILFIPVEIGADIALRRKNVDSISTSNFLSIKDRKNILIDAVEWSDHWLDDLETTQYNCFFKDGFTLADFSREIFMYFDYIFYLINLVESVILKLSPETIIFPFHNDNLITRIDHRNDFLLGTIGKLVGHKYKVKIIELGKNKPNRTNEKNNNIIAKYSTPEFIGKLYSRFMQGLNHGIVSNSKDGFSQLNDSDKKKLNGKKLLIMGGETIRPYWRMEYLIEYLSKIANCESIPLFSLDDQYNFKAKGLYLSDYKDIAEASTNFKELNQITHSVVENNLFNSAFYRDINLNNFCFQKLSFIIKTCLRNYWISYMSMDIIAKKTKFDIFLSSHYAQYNPSNRAVLHYCENAGIPTLVISHGTQFCRFNRDVDKLNDIKNFFFPTENSHYAVIGDYVKKKFLDDGIKESNIRTTGNLEYKKADVSPLNKWLYLKKLNLSNRKKTIVYLLQRVTREWHFNYLFLSFDEMRQEICDIMKVADILDCQLIIKPHPAFAKSDEWIKSWAPNTNYRMEFNPKNNPFILTIADIVIGSNTSVNIEALDYGVPTIIYSQEMRHFLDWQQDIAAPIDDYEKEIDKYFIRSTGFDDLFNTCETILNNSTFQPTFVDKLKKADPWVHCNSDGQQPKRITEFICTIFDEKRVNRIRE
jgi:hypothetical protein